MRMESRNAACLLIRGSQVRILPGATRKAPAIGGFPLSSGRTLGPHVATGEVTRARETQEPVRPLLVRLFEAVAVIMDSDAGYTRLEVAFDGGHVRRRFGPCRSATLARPTGPRIDFGARGAGSALTRKSDSKAGLQVSPRQ